MTSKKKLWVVSELYYPELTSTGYFLTKIAEGLSEEFSVSAVCGQPNYAERGVHAPTRETHNKVDVHRLWSTKFARGNTFLRIINMVTFSASVLIFALFNFARGDQVLVVTNPPSVAPVVGLAAVLRRCKATLLVHDVYPEVLATAGGLKRTGPVYRFLFWLFSRSYALFDSVVVLGRDMKDIVSNKRSSRQGALNIITNWADIDEVIPISRENNDLRFRMKLGNKFIVQFSGNIGRTHDLEIILSAANILKQYRDIAFLFVGEGFQSELVQAQANASKAGNLHFLPRQPRNKLNAMLAASDVTIIPFIDGMYGLSVPSRMYNIMAAGVPIIAIADRKSELALTITENCAGWVLAERSPESLAKLISQLATQDGRAMTKLRGANGRRAAETKYPFEAVLDGYRRVLT